jgi:hypothetical protein
MIASDNRMHATEQLAAANAFQARLSHSDRPFRSCNDFAVWLSGNSMRRSDLSYARDND